MEGVGCVSLVCKMQRGQSKCAKRARLLSLNQIREIVMDSNSDEAQYNTSGMEDEEMEPRPPSRKSPLSQAVSSSDFSANTSEDEDVVENVASQQSQSMQWTLPPYPPMRVLHPFTGAPKGKSSEAVHVTAQSTPLNFLMPFFGEIITLLVVETNRYYHDCLDGTDKQHHPQRDVPGRNVCVSGSDTTDGTHSSRQTRGLLDEMGAGLLSILQTNNGTF